MRESGGWIFHLVLNGWLAADIEMGRATSRGEWFISSTMITATSMMFRLWCILERACWPLPTTTNTYFRWNIQGADTQHIIECPDHTLRPYSIKWTRRSTFIQVADR